MKVPEETMKEFLNKYGLKEVLKAIIVFITNGKLETYELKLIKNLATTLVEYESKYEK